MAKVVVFPFKGFEKIGAETYLNEMREQEGVQEHEAADLILLGTRQEQRADPRLVRWAEAYVEQWKRRPCSYASEPFPPVRVSEFTERYWHIISDNDVGERLVVSDSPIRFA